jgi:tetratricopeptide (TPR) repeat protein
LGLLKATNDPEAALEPLASAAELDPSLASEIEVVRRSITSARISDEPAYTLVSAGRALASLDHWDLAAEAFYQATLLRPDYAEAWAFLGGARMALPASTIATSQAPSAHGDAWADIQAAIELDNASLAAHNFAVMYWENQNRHDMALQAAQRAVDLAPEEPDLRIQLGNLLAISGNLEGAYQAYQQASELAPYEPDYLVSLVRFSLNHGYKLSEVALPAARQALNQAPQDPVILNLMSEVLIQLGDLATAQRFNAQALTLEPNDPTAHMHLGLILINQGDMQRGYEELTLAASLVDAGALSDQIQRLLAIYSQEQ